MKTTHYEHGTRMARMDRTMRGTAERYIQWKNRTLSFDPGPTRYTHSLGIFVGGCYALFFVTIAGCAGFMTWVALVIGFLPGMILGAIGCMFFGYLTLMMTWAMLRAAALLFITKRGLHGNQVRGRDMAGSGNPSAP